LSCDIVNATPTNSDRRHTTYKVTKLTDYNDDLANIHNDDKRYRSDSIVSTDFVDVNIIINFVEIINTLQ